MTSPGVEISRVWVIVLSVLSSVKMEYKFVWREINITKCAFDTFSSRTVISGWFKMSCTAPTTVVNNLEVKAVREFWRSIIF